MVPITSAATRVAAMTHTRRIKSIIPTPLFPPAGGTWPTLMGAATNGGAPFPVLDDLTSLMEISISPLSFPERFESLKGF